MFKGIFTPAITIFDEKGNIDYDGNRRIIDRLVESGVDGILFLGSIGEFFALTFEEKKKLISFAVRTVGGRVKALVGTGGTVVKEVTALTQFAQGEGADAAVVISPYYMSTDEDSLYRYYTEVAASVKMPVLLYNFPDRTAVDIPPRLVRRLAQEVPNIVGIKDTVDTISHTRKLVQAVRDLPKEFSVFSGFDEYLIPNLMAGGAGIIGGLTNIAPRLFVALYRAFREGDLARVRALEEKVCTLMRVYDVANPFITAIKAAVAQTVPGICGDPRPPFAGCDGAQTDAIREILRTAGQI